jgi:Transmembrane protein 131-like N-terminal
VASDPAPASHAVAAAAGSVAIAGDNYGIVNTGVLHIHAGATEGTRVELVSLSARPRVRARRRLTTRPAPTFANHLDRDHETAQVIDRLAGSRAVNVHGTAGIGKTYVLAATVERQRLRPREEGALYLIGRGRALNDVLQELFDGLHTCRDDVRLPDDQLRKHLRRRSGLMVIDSAELSRQDTEELINTLGNGSKVLIGSLSRLYWQGPDFRITGLDQHSAVALFEQEFGRALDDDERRTADQICLRLDGHPLNIRLAASLVRDRHLTLDQLALDPNQSGAPRLVEDVLSGFSEDQLRLLATLKLLDGVSLGRERLAALTASGEVEALLRDPERLGLVQRHSPRWSATALLTQTQTQLDQQTAEARLALTSSLIDWASSAKPAEITTELDALLATSRLAHRGLPKEFSALARSVEPALIATKRWDACEEILLGTLEVAQQRQDADSEAWATHELGTRALALGQRAAAIGLLQQAEQLRTRLEDDAGLRVTRHNLAVAKRPIPWLHRMLDRWFPTVSIVTIVALLAGLTGLVAAGTAVAVAFGHHHRGRTPIVNPPTVNPAAVVFGAQTIGDPGSRKEFALTAGSKHVTLAALRSSNNREFHAHVGTHCQIALRPRQSCPITIDFTPFRAGTQDGLIRLRLSDGTTLTVTVTGTGLPPLSLKLLPKSVTFQPQREGTASDASTVTLTAGSQPLAIDQITTSDTQQFPATTRCGHVLASQHSCVVNIRFAPTRAGTVDEALQITLHNKKKLVVHLHGIGKAGTAPALFPRSLDLGHQKVGTTTAPRTVTLTAGDEQLHITSVHNSNSREFPVSSDCPSTLQRDKSCHLAVLFNPTTAGRRSADVTISTGTGPPLSFKVSGAGVTVASASLIPRNLAFGNVELGEHVDLNEQVRAEGGTLTVNTVTTSDPQQFTVASHCKSPLKAGHACSLIVTFTPTAAGQKNATLTLTTSAGPLQTMLRGTGTSPLQPTLAPDNLTFGQQELGTKSAKSLTLTAGSKPVTIAKVETTSRQFAVSNRCPTTLSPKQSCELTIVFIPSTAGDQNDRLTITTSVGPLQAMLHGTGTTPLQPSLTPNSVTFDPQELGTTSPGKDVTLTAGSKPLTISTMRTTSQQFALTNKCPTTLRPKASCTITMSFRPVAAGIQTATLTVITNLSQTLTAAVSGQGQAAGSRVAPASISFTAKNQTKSATLTVDGPAHLTIASIAITNNKAYSYTNHCPNPIAVRTSCTIDILFNGDNSDPGTLTITRADGSYLTVKLFDGRIK